jgi:hypothetical protein
LKGGSSARGRRSAATHGHQRGEHGPEVFPGL